MTNYIEIEIISNTFIEIEIISNTFIEIEIISLLFGIFWLKIRKLGQQLVSEPTSSYTKGFILPESKNKDFPELGILFFFLANFFETQ